jgi:hypothetical protein
MSKLRNSQTWDSRINTFYDLPDMIRVGTILLDKHTLDPIVGYDIPNIPMNWLINGNTKGQPTIANYGNENPLAINNAMPHNFGLAQHGYMTSNLYPLQHVPETNIVEDLGKTYVVDPNNPDYIYFVHESSSFNSEMVFVKFDMKKQEIIWANRYSPCVDVNGGAGYEDFGRVKYKIWKFKGNILYLIVENMTHSISATVVSYGTYTKMIMGISTENGSILKPAKWTNLNNTTTPVLQNTMPTTISCGNTLIPIFDLTENETVFFANCIDTTSHNVAAPAASRAKFRAGFVIYNFASHGFTIPEDISVNEMPVTTNMIALPIPVNTYGPKYHMPKASSRDKSVTNSYRVYSCWNILKEFDNASVLNTSIEVKRICRFDYDKMTNTQSVTPMNVFYSEDVPMQKIHWNVFSGARDVTTYTSYSQPYIIYGENKKYLFIYENQISLSTNGKVFWYLFEFLDENTLILRDSKTVNVQDILWLADNKFIALTRQSITFYTIDTDTGKFISTKSLSPTKSTNKFIFGGLDDVQNFWYAEAIANPSNTSYFNNFDLNFINSYTVDRIEITKEKNTYDFVGDPIETYIDIKTIGDYGDIISRNIEIKILGPAKFTENGIKVLQTTTNTDTTKRINVTITGVGEVIFSASLVKV